MMTNCVVSLQQNNISYGYVVLDFFTDNIITEFVIEKGAACIGDAILQETDTVTALQRTSASKIKKMYKTYPFEYSVVLENRGSEVIYDKDGEISKEAFHDQRKFMQSSIDLSNSGESNKFAHFSEIIINSIPSGYTTVDSLQTLPSKVSLTEADIIKLTSKYACVVQAMANIASQNNLLYDNNILDTYNYLWNVSETTVTKTEGGITYGSTEYNKMGPALVKLAKALGKSNSSYVDTDSPSYASFKSAVQQGKSSILGAGYQKTDGTRSGHAVSVVGYRSAKDSSNKLHSYIYIADGWYSSFRYICISDTDNFIDTMSTVLTIK